MRHTFLYPLHLALPVMGSLLFLLYFCVTGGSSGAQVSGYAEVIGIALPFAVSIVCAGNVGLEEKNHFQVFLGGTLCKGNSFLAKFLALLGLGSLAVLAAVLLFGAGYGGLPGKENLSFRVYGWLAVILCAGSIPLYLEHLFLNLMFSKQVSLSVSVAQFLLSALFLTGLGDGRWPFFPCTWSAKGAALFLAYATGNVRENIFTGEMRGVSLVCLLLMSALCVIIGVWFRFYEGRQCDD